MKKKILFVILPPMWYRLPLYKEIASSKHYDVTFVFSKNMYQTYHFKEDEVVRNMYIFIKENLDSKTISGNLPSVFKILSKEDYDYVVGGSWDSCKEVIELLIFYFVTLFRRKKWIIWNNVRWRGSIKRFRIRILDSFLEFLIKKAHRVVVASQKAAVYIQNLGFPRNKIKKIPNVSEVFLKQKEINQKYQDALSKNKINILFVGRVNIPFKGVKYLLDAFNRLRKTRSDVSLILVGDSKDEFDSENDIYHFKGVNPDRIAQIYKNADILVLPSIETKEGNNEGWGLVVNEAYQFGLPVIVTNKVGCQPDIVKDGVNGYIVKEKDPDQLFERLNALCSDKGLRKKIGAGNKRFFEKNLRYADVGKQWRDFFEAIS